MLLENVTNRFAQCRVATNLQFVKSAVCLKQNKAKPKKARYACILSHRIPEVGHPAIFLLCHPSSTAWAKVPASLAVHHIHTTDHTARRKGRANRTQATCLTPSLTSDYTPLATPSGMRASKYSFLGSHMTVRKKC